MSRNHIVFFRNASTDPGSSDADEDRYESAAASLGYTAHTQPVLAQEFVHEDDLVRTIGMPEEWAGVVATSKRAGEAWVNALRRSIQTGNRIPKWDNTPLYTPGAATTAGFGARDLDGSSFPSIMAESEATGCAEFLGPCIVSDVRTRFSEGGAPSSANPLLVLTGDKNSPELTDILRRDGIAYGELEVYRTCPRPDIRQRLSALLGEILVDADQTSRPVTVWLAFFSPSSAAAVLSASPPMSSSDARPSPWYEHLAQALPDHGKRIDFRIAAIGKTTRLYLEQQGFERVVQAERPNAESLARAIADGDEDAGVAGAGAGASASGRL